MTAPNQLAAVAIAKLSTPDGTAESIADLLSAMVKEGTVLGEFIAPEHRERAAEQLTSHLKITGVALRLLQLAGPDRLDDLTTLVIEALRR